MYGGCLPMLLQMPLFFAYYRVLLNAVELRQAHWFWLTDLSSPDPLKILPILIIITMFLTQFITPSPGVDPNPAPHDGHRHAPHLRLHALELSLRASRFTGSPATSSCSPCSSASTAPTLARRCTSWPENAPPARPESTPKAFRAKNSLRSIEQQTAPDDPGAATFPHSIWLRPQHFEPWKIGGIARAIPCQKGEPLDRSVSADVKIG